MSAPGTRGVVERVATMAPASRLLLALAMVAAIAAMGGVPGSDLSVAPLYTLPVAYAAWFLPLRGALAVTATSAGLALWSDLEPQLARQPQQDALVRLLAFLGLQAGLIVLRSTFDTARTDQITGVADRGAFIVGASAELRRARRYRRSLTVSILDIDDFEGLNDHIGRYAGDAVLRSAGQSLRRMLRASDLVARFESDAFALLLPEADFAGATATLEKIRDHLPHALERGAINPSFCVGAVTWASAPDSVEALLGAAERALARAKTRGPGSFEHEVITPHPTPSRIAGVAA